ncbi:unnamed protein product [Durusdinium trenchii]|uniref:Desumoylating isopeptidase 2 n=1 Tax=Durusdinium trenchii TaxID=1381693 RepID=A0ABP0PLK2_9DINO
MACMGQRRASRQGALAHRQEEDGLRCVGRLPQQVTLQGNRSVLRAAEGHLEIFQPGGWLTTDAWVPTDAEVSYIEDGMPRMVVSKLEAETEYSFRWITKLGGEARCSCSTAGKPLAPRKLRTLRRRPKGLTVQVEASHESDGLPLLACELQWCQFSWTSWSSKLVTAEDAGSVAVWEIFLENLSLCSDYQLRARFCNAVGWSQDFTEGSGRTSDIASAPWDLKLVARRPKQVIFECQVKDPEGAPITDLEVQLCGKVTWGAATPPRCSASVPSWDWDELGGGPSRSVQVTVSNLPADVTSEVRVWSQNLVGRSRVPSSTLLCQPSSRPEEVKDLHCSRRALEFIELQWRTQDPEGAPILECTVEFWCESSIWATVQQAPVSRTDEHSHSSWTATLCGLAMETAYVVRLRSSNEVGTKEDIASFRTAQRPVAPKTLTCGDITATTIQLRFELSYDPGQLCCVVGLSKLLLEEAGTLSWAAVVEEKVKILQALVKGDRLHALVEVQGLQSDCGYRFRLWPENPVGRSFQPSGVLDCRTSHKPERPRELRVEPKGPYHVRLYWEVPDPAGAPVYGAVVEVSVQSMFGSWRSMGEGSLQRYGRGWMQAVYGLEPQQEYIFRVKAQNDSGWSEWSDLLVWTSVSTPRIQTQMASLHRIHDASRSNDSGRAASLMLTFPVSAPAAAPCAAVAVRCGARGALASRVGSKWMASFPGLEGEHVTFHIEAANAVGWDRQDLSLQFSNQSPGNAESESPVEAFASRCAEQSDLWDEELCFGKEARFEEARLVKRALQVSKLKEKPEVSWLSRCEDFLPSPEPKSMEGLATAMVAFQLLMEGGFALEQLKQDAEGLWQNLLFLAEALPEEDGWTTWSAKRDAWAAELQEKFAFGWSRVCAAAVCLLAAALGKGDLILPLSDAKQSLRRLLETHAWLEQSLQEIRSSAEDLYQVLMGSDVALSIYELHGTAAVTALTQLAGLGGAFHVGVQVYWLEWSFGWCQDGSGIQALRFGTSDLGRFRERLPLGRTPLAPEEVLAVLADMRKQWDGQSYDLLRRNCAHFSVDFVRRLRVEEAPEWINALATAGGQIAQWLGVFRPVLLQEDSEALAEEKADLASPSPAELEEWAWALEYIKERSAEARRIRQKSTLRAAATLRSLPRRDKAARRPLADFDFLSELSKCPTTTNENAFSTGLALQAENYPQFLRARASLGDDPAVHEAVASLMGAPPSGAAAVTEVAPEAGEGGEGSEARNHPPLIATESFGGTDEEPPAPNEPDHADMAPDLLLDVLQASQSDKGSRDASIVSFAAQAIVAGKAEAKYKVSVEEIRIDIENAVLVHQGALTSNTEFAVALACLDQGAWKGEVNVKMQKAIAKLMG